MITISASSPVVKFSDRVKAAVAANSTPCSHKFIDSTSCLKCGWTPPAPIDLCIRGVATPRAGEPAEITRAEIEAFITAASNRHLAVGKAKYPGCPLNWETLAPQWGKKYIRLVTICNGQVRSAFGFIEIATGNLLKAAGWSAPAKGVRGNIRIGDASNGWNGAVGDHGMAYLR